MKKKKGLYYIVCNTGINSKLLACSPGTGLEQNIISIIIFEYLASKEHCTFIMQAVFLLFMKSCYLQIIILCSAQLIYD